jgi:hypothetical protein
MAQFKPLQGSGTAVGGDVTELRAFASHLTTKAIPDFKDVFLKIDAQINNTTWQGNDAKTFAEKWEQHKNEITQRLEGMLNETSEQAKQQAQQQETTSA